MTHSLDDAVAQSGGMAGLRSVFDNSLFLVSGASSGGILAGAKKVALSGLAAGVGSDVGCDGIHHAAMAAGGALFEGMDVGSGATFVWDRPMVVFAIEQEFQRAATGRLAGGDFREWGTAAGDDGDSGAGAASGVSGASL